MTHVLRVVSQGDDHWTAELTLKDSKKLLAKASFFLIKLLGRSRSRDDIIMYLDQYTKDISEFAEECVVKHPEFGDPIPGWATYQTSAEHDGRPGKKGDLNQEGTFDSGRLIYIDRIQVMSNSTSDIAAAEPESEPSNTGTDSQKPFPKGRGLGRYFLDRVIQTVGKWRSSSCFDVVVLKPFPLQHEKSKPVKNQGAEGSGTGDPSPAKKRRREENAPASTASSCRFDDQKKIEQVWQSMGFRQFANHSKWWGRHEALQHPDPRHYCPDLCGELSNQNWIVEINKADLEIEDEEHESGLFSDSSEDEDENPET